MLKTATQIAQTPVSKVSGITNPEAIDKSISSSWGKRFSYVVKDLFPLVEQATNYVSKLLVGEKLINDEAYQLMSSLYSYAPGEYERISSGLVKAIPTIKVIDDSTKKQAYELGSLVTVTEFASFIKALAGYESSFGDFIKHDKAKVGEDVGAFGLNTAFHADRVRRLSSKPITQMWNKVIHNCYMTDASVTDTFKWLTRKYSGNFDRSGDPSIAMDVEGIGLVIVDSILSLGDKGYFLRGLDLMTFVLNAWYNPIKTMETYEREQTVTMLERGLSKAMEMPPAVKEVRYDK